MATKERKKKRRRRRKKKKKKKPRPREFALKSVPYTGISLLSSSAEIRNNLGTLRVRPRGYKSIMSMGLLTKQCGLEARQTDSRNHAHVRFELDGEFKVERALLRFSTCCFQSCRLVTLAIQIQMGLRLLADLLSEQWEMKHWRRKTRLVSSQGPRQNRMP